MKNFEIGKELRQILIDANIEGIDNKIFPLIANPDTTFPFLVYRRTSYQSARTKDIDDEIVSVDIVICALKYEESVNIAKQVAEALNRKETTLIDDILISNIYEDYIEDTFVQHISVDIYIK